MDQPGLCNKWPCDFSTTHLFMNGQCHLSLRVLMLPALPCYVVPCLCVSTVSTQTCIVTIHPYCISATFSLTLLNKNYVRHTYVYMCASNIMEAFLQLYNKCKNCCVVKSNVVPIFESFEGRQYNYY